MMRQCGCMRILLYYHYQCMHLTECNTRRNHHYSNRNALCDSVETPPIFSAILCPSLSTGRRQLLSSSRCLASFSALSGEDNSIRVSCNRSWRAGAQFQAIQQLGNEQYTDVHAAGTKDTRLEVYNSFGVKENRKSPVRPS